MTRQIIEKERQWTRLLFLNKRSPNAVDVFLRPGVLLDGVASAMGHLLHFFVNSATWNSSKDDQRWQISACQRDRQHDRYSISVLGRCHLCLTARRPSLLSEADDLAHLLVVIYASFVRIEDFFCLLHLEQSLASSLAEVCLDAIHIISRQRRYRRSFERKAFALDETLNQTVQALELVLDECLVFLQKYRPAGAGLGVSSAAAIEEQAVVEVVGRGRGVGLERQASCCWAVGPVPEQLQQWEVVGQRLHRSVGS